MSRGSEFEGIQISYHASFTRTIVKSQNAQLKQQMGEWPTLTAPARGRNWIQAARTMRHLRRNDRLGEDSAYVGMMGTRKLIGQRGHLVNSPVVRSMAQRKSAYQVACTTTSTYPSLFPPAND